MFVTAKEIIMSRACLFCTSAADSPEHLIPQALGGRLARKLLCGKHNNEINDRCDKPLIKQFEFFVHALRVVQERSDPGKSVSGISASGETYIVDADHKPRLPKTQILAYNPSTKLPHIIKAPDEASARRILTTMQLDPDIIPFEVITQPSEKLEFAIQLGGPDGLRGILKIAYEYVVGYLGAPVDVDEDQALRTMLLVDGDCAEYVRWLPFEFADQLPQAEYFSHRIIAAPVADGTLVVIELFTVAPFLIRLPGITISAPRILVQNLIGDLPFESQLFGTIPFDWENISAHAQPQMLDGLRQRTSTILETMAISDAMAIIVPSFAKAVTEHAAASDDIIMEATITAFEEETGRAVTEPLRVIIANMVTILLLPHYHDGSFKVPD
ncbi:MAG: hypothetical protein IAI48_08135 [Candidatus Eremiobacteraeota bacterium]|nr:hypothetical protein [Candidatus Eremiobacteraeota bacterium]